MSIEDEDRTKLISANNESFHTALDNDRTLLKSADIERNEQKPVAEWSQLNNFSYGGNVHDMDATLLDPRPQTPSPGNFLNNSTLHNKTHLEIGDVLKNRFELVANLGEGGMGMVFKAIDRRKVEAKSRNPYIAIKVLNPSLAKNDLLVAGLQRECEKAQELSHPNIITVYDFDIDGDNVFMSMEFLSGGSLSQLIREGALGGGISFQRAWPLIKQMSKALAYAHTRNIVHSDFKPANVIITDEHEVKVLDLGIAAKTEHGNDPDATIFNARAEGGHTPPYASFEMMNGANADPRDDIYALGIVVYEMLTGKHPYNRKSASEVFIEQQKNSNQYSLAPVKGLNARQWKALKSAIEILQDKRPKSIDVWLEQLDPTSSKRHSQVIVGIVSLSLLGVGYMGYKFFKPQESDVPINESSPSPVPTQPVAVATTASVKLPIAIPGSNQQGKVGETIMLNGGASQSGDGEPISYSWRFTQVPADSQVMLQRANLVNPAFTPDKSGEYLIELVVVDGHNNSLSSTVAVTVSEDMHPLIASASNVDNLLQLSTSKARYRIGEQLKINLRVLRAGYLRIAYIGASGEVSELLPNQYQSTKVKANTELFLPSKAAKYKLEITGPIGVDKIVAVFSELPIPNLEKMVDANGNIAISDQKNMVTKTIEYAVYK